MKTPDNTSVTESTLSLTDAGFDAVLAADEKPLLVDFHATWCPPCRAIAPAVEELAASHGDRVRVAKADIDLNPELVERFGITSVPTFVLLRGDEVLDRFGSVSPGELAERVEQHV